MAAQSRKATRPPRTARRASRPARTASPAARGQAAADVEREIDGCDVDFTQLPITEDAELPAARGGVEIPRLAQRRAAKRR